jgi:hypothetical protein
MALSRELSLARPATGSTTLPDPHRGKKKQLNGLPER